MTAEIIIIVVDHLLIFVIKIKVNFLVNQNLIVDMKDQTIFIVLGEMLKYEFMLIRRVLVILGRLSTAQRSKPKDATEF